MLFRGRRAFGRVGVVAVAALTIGTGAQVVLLESAQADTSNIIPSQNPIDFTPHVLNNQARSIAAVGNRVVIGGTFTTIQNYNSSQQLSQPYVFAFNPTNGSIDQSFLPNVNGEVTTVLAHPDGDKVWVAGAFSRVNGEPHSRIVLLNLATGNAVSSFDPPTISAEITSMKLANGQLYIGGDFASVGNQSRRAMASLDPVTGALTNHMSSDISGTLQDGKGVPSIKSFDLSPNGKRLVAIGNFNTVDGQSRLSMAMWNTSGAVAVLKNWGTQRYGNVCNPVFPTYLRDIDFAPNGKFFVVVTTGSYRFGQLCDTAARWDVKGKGVTRQPNWVNYTGGDTLTAVEVTGPMAYLGGHMRWLNNPYKGDAAGSGAWPTEGLAVVDTRNGMPFSWNPGRDRGLGVFDFLPTDSMLWSVSDTNNWAGEYRPRLAGFPFGANPIPADNLGKLPGDVWQLGGVAGAGADDQRGIGFDGTVVQSSTTGPGAQPWSDVRGAFAVDDTLYTAWSNSTFTAQSWDGTTIGTPQNIDLYAGTPSTPGYPNNFVNDLAKITGMTYDPVRARIYYTMQGSSQLYWRPFTPESRLVGAARRTLTKSKPLSPGKVRGMFLTSTGDLYFADSVTGALKRAKLASNKVRGPATVVNTEIDWRSNALFLSSQWATIATNVPPTAAFSTKCTGLDCVVNASKSADADGGVVDYSIDFGDGTVVTGKSAQHQYGGDGDYSVTVTVTDNRGMTGSISQPVSVQQLPNVDPTASFTMDCWGLDCTVDASASTDADGAIVSYDWDFGDSASGSGATAIHSYGVGGQYSATLTVTDNRGGIGTTTVTKDVNAIPTTVAFRDAASAEQANGNLPTVSVPPATQEGDLMLLFISNGTDRTADTPSGWNVLGEQTDVDLRTQVFWRVATAGNLGSSVSARLRDGTGTASLAPNTSTIAVYSGVGSPPVVDAVSSDEPSTVNGGVAAHTTPNVTVPADGQWLVSYWADRTAALTTQWTAPSGQAVRTDAYSSGPSSRVSSLLTDDGGPTLAGTRGGLTAVADGASRKATTWSIVLRSQ